MGLKDELITFISERMHKSNTPGLGITVFHKGKIDCCIGFGVLQAGTQYKATTHSLFHACSISKMITSMGVLCLVQEGVLDLDEDVNKYLASWKVRENKYTTAKKVTLNDLLSHQAGFMDPEGSFDIYIKTDPLPVLNDILMGVTRYNPRPLEIMYEPSSQYCYSDAGFCVVEKIIEDSTGGNFADVMNQLIMIPLGLKRSFFWNHFNDKAITEDYEIAVGHDQYGRIVDGKRAYYPYLASAGFWTTPEELAKLTLEIVESWSGSKKSILQPDMARLMLSSYGCNNEAGRGVFLHKKNGELNIVSKGWGIGFQCMLSAYPRLRSGIVIMTNSDPGKDQDESMIGEVIQHITKFYSWLS